MTSSSTPSSAGCAPPFQLHWTIGFTGKRFFGEDPIWSRIAEAKAARALSQAVEFLREKAQDQDSKLTAVSSLARGGDILFAKTCLAVDHERPTIPWKCVLPFSKADFFHFDLATDAKGDAVPPDEIRRLREEAEACLKMAYDTDSGSWSPCDASDITEQRVVAYLECGYRTVDEADVMICLMRDAEFRSLTVTDGSPRMERNGASKSVPAQSLKAGTHAVARYAIAARRPCILLNLDADDPWVSRTMVNAPTEESGGLFVDPVVSSLIGRTRDPFDLPLDLGEMPSGPDTAARRSVLHLQKRLGAIANNHQGRAVGGLKWMLSLHLLATSIAALSATVFRVNHDGPHPVAIAVTIGLLALALIKPILAFAAERIEKFLHHHGERDLWLHSRELAEICRGALSTWPLPVQPLKAPDEEDFPKLKRLLRTLHLMRALDGKTAAVSGSRCFPATDSARPWEGETQGEADMRAASEIYIESRLRHQAAFYRQHHEKGTAIERCWHLAYVVAIWSAIGCGLLLAGIKVLHIFHENSDHLGMIDCLSAAVIIAPFAASYALGMMTIHDCRRRARRYAEMEHYLVRLGDTLQACRANSSRLRIIEHAERMLIEEQHEWFSVTRNYNV